MLYLIKKTTKLIIPLLGIVLIMACVKIEEPSSDESIKYLALGDSYTIGQGVDEKDRWPNQLTEKLKEQNYDMSSTKIIAKTGWTTTNLLTALENESLENYDLVSLLIGVNNQFQNGSFTLFQNEFNLLLNKSINYTGNKDRVFVVSIPDYGVTPFGSSNSEQIAQELDMYNNYMRQQCKAMDIDFIDITEISRTLGDSSGALASDNLHPSGMQYTEWINEILPIVLAQLD